MLRTPAPRRRRGYTLVEAMVAMGLAVLTMWILAESFRVGMDMIGQSRAAGTMMTQLSSLGALFHRDLVHAHPFLPDDNRPNRGLRLSDQRLDLLNQQGMGWTPPPGGFFRIISNQNGFSPIADDEGLQLPPSYANHALHFTAILPQNDTNLFRVNLNGKVFESRAAEVAYFLVDTGTTTSPGGPRLYHLVRRQRLVAVDPLQRQRLNTQAAPDSYNDFIASKPALTGQPGSAYTLREIQTPSNRLPVEPPNLPYNPGMTPPPSPRLSFPLGDPRYGEDIVLSNVLSFEIRVEWTRNTTPPTGLLGSITGVRTIAATPPNTDHPFDYLSLNSGWNSNYQNAGVFDTWHLAAAATTPGGLRAWNDFNKPPHPNALPLAVRVHGIQITVRMFDPKTRMVRQNTWRFAL